MCTILCCLFYTANLEISHQEPAKCLLNTKLSFQTNAQTNLAITCHQAILCNANHWRFAPIPIEYGTIGIALASTVAGLSNSVLRFHSVVRLMTTVTHALLVTPLGRVNLKLKNTCASLQICPFSSTFPYIPYTIVYYAKKDN